MSVTLASGIMATFWVISPEVRIKRLSVATNQSCRHSRIFQMARAIRTNHAHHSRLATMPSVANLLWWAWFVLIARAIWKILEWRHDWFVATDKRLILTYGLITQKVAMMPLAKVTDMSYNRSPLGRILGYGTFVMESAGQDQALHRVEWVPSPDQTYRAICAEIF